MCLTEFDQEAYDNRRRKEGYDNGYSEGAHNQAVETAINALKMNLSLEQITQLTGLPVEEILKLKEAIPVEA